MHPQKRKNDGTAKDCDGVWQLAAARWGSTIRCRSRTRRRACVEGGDFWRPVVERVREIEVADASPWGDAKETMIRFTDSPVETAALLAAELLGHN